MISRVGDGPETPPPGARSERISAWGRYHGMVWQLGDRVGMVWDERPTWSDHILDRYGRMACPTPKRSEWLFSTGAAAYYDQLVDNVRFLGRAG